MGDRPLVPLFAAVDANEDADILDWSAVDVVTDRNALRHLFRWASGNTSKGFRLDLQLLGKKTLLLVRWGKQTSEERPGRYSYGFNYLNGTTKKAHSESVAHHRILNYDWNGLNMVVRSMVCTFLPSDNDSKSEEDLNDITSAISSLNVARDKEQVTDVKGTTLKVIHGGAIVPQESIVKVATMSIYRESQMDWEEKDPLLYFARIPHFYVALHDRGSFTKVRKHRFDYATLPFKIKENLKKVRQVLAVIQRVIAEKGQRRHLSLVCIDGKLEVYERVDDKNVLPDEFLERFGL